MKGRLYRTWVSFILIFFLQKPSICKSAQLGLINITEADAYKYNSAILIFFVIRQETQILEPLFKTE